MASEFLSLNIVGRVFSNIFFFMILYHHEQHAGHCMLWQNLFSIGNFLDLEYCYSTTPLRRLLCLLQTILRRHDLAISVWHLSLLPASVNPWTEPKPDTNRNQVSSCFMDMTIGAIEVIQKAGFSDVEQWKSGSRLRLFKEELSLPWQQSSSPNFHTLDLLNLTVLLSG